MLRNGFCDRLQIKILAIAGFVYRNRDDPDLLDTRQPGYQLNYANISNRRIKTLANGALGRTAHEKH